MVPWRQFRGTQGNEAPPISPVEKPGTLGDRMQKSRIKVTLADLLRSEDLKDLGLELELGKNKKGHRQAALIGSERSAKLAERRAERRRIAAQFRKLGGRILNLCEPCEWLTLGSDVCKKCTGGSI